MRFVKLFVKVSRVVAADSMTTSDEQNIVTHDQTFQRKTDKSLQRSIEKGVIQLLRGQNGRVGVCRKSTEGHGTKVS